MGVGAWILPRERARQSNEAAPRTGELVSTVGRVNTATARRGRESRARVVGLARAGDTPGPGAPAVKGLSLFAACPVFALVPVQDRPVGQPFVTRSEVIAK